MLKLAIVSVDPDGNPVQILIDRDIRGAIEHKLQGRLWRRVVARVNSVLDELEQELRDGTIRLT